MYITEVIQDTYKNWNAKDIIFLEAPTGSGKTTFVLEELVPYARQNGKEVLFITNRTLLKAQIKAKVAKEQGIPTDDTKLLESTEAFDAITIVSYQKIQEIESNGCAGTYYDKERYQYIVCDEIHYILEDSLFNAKTYYFAKFLARESGITRILISATLKETKNYLLNNNIMGEIRRNSKEWCGEWCYRALRCTSVRSYVWHYYFPRSLRKLKIYYFDDYEQIAERINADDKKWLVFINNKEQISRFYKKIQREFEVVHAGKKDAEVIEQIVNHERFEQDVLITTKLLDNGVNFKDSELRNLVIDTISETEFLQMLGRKRITENEEISLYIPKKSKKYFSDYFHQSIKPTEAVLRKYSDCNDNLTDEDEQTRAIVIKNANKFKIKEAIQNLLLDSEECSILRRYAVFDQEELRINELGKHKIDILSAFVRSMNDKITTDEWAFVKEQLKWLGVENTFAIENDLTFHNDQKVLEEIRTYVESLKNQPLIKEEKNAFIGQMNKYMRQISSEYLKADRVVKKNRIQKFFEKYELPYVIKALGGKKKGEETKWVIEDMEV